MKYQFVAGDKVALTNDNDVKIRGVKTILAIDTSSSDARYLIAPSDSPWFSVPERQLSIVEDAVGKKV